MPKKILLEKEEILWKDRRRYLGLPLSFTRYRVCKQRLILKCGFFHTSTDEILLYRIMDIRLKRTLGQKILGVGTVTLTSADKSFPTLELKNIRHPDHVRRLLSNLIDQQRKERGIGGSELLGGGRPRHDHHGHGGHDGGVIDNTPK